MTVEYTVHVPRDSRLVVHQDNGYVWVSDVTGDIEVDSHTGDMIVMLPDPGPYSIDARTRLGSVSSDFTGQGAQAIPGGYSLRSRRSGSVAADPSAHGPRKHHHQERPAVRSFLEELRRRSRQKAQRGE